MFERTALPAGPARDQRPAPGGALGLDRRVRARRVAPRDAPARSASPTSWSTSRSRARRAYPSTRAISEAIEGVGGSFNAATDRESTVYWVRVPRREAERAMDVVGELIVRPTLDERRHPERARGHHRGDPLVPRRPVRVLPDPVPDRDVRRRAARPRDLRRRGRHPGPARGGRSTTSGGRAYRPANTVVAVVGDLEHDEAVEPRRRGVRDRQRRRARVRSRRPRCPPARASGPASATRARRSSASASRRCTATTPTAGRWPCSTRSSATG